ncbi:vacuolar protein sorting-associated protein 37D-like [Nothobranchius furzeri]|uniref:Vacuolar protein sorting-associated protein 37C-like n=1 Tax=Nothobranchius furzeri TaxID=105023 RepID=A0A1A7ZPN5_NOTFU|nr:vacuolar protein sorting-associated protein 37C-like [Nothobranchius furzeri]
MSVQVGALRTSELRELLEDEVKISRMVRSSRKSQRLRYAAEKLLDSNEKLAKSSLSLKPKFRDTKLLLGMKHKEQENLRCIMRAKQEQLAEMKSICDAELRLLQKINRADEEFELLFQRFAEGETALAEFLESFLVSRKLHHVRLMQVKKLQEIKEHEVKPTLNQFFPVGIPHQIHPIYGLTTAAYDPPLFLLPLCTYSDPGDSLQQSPFGFGHPVRCRWPVRPGRLQPLMMQQRKQRDQ